jgi:hypothetical protein
MGVIVPEVRYGGGRHAAYIDPPSNITVGLHYNYITQPLCLISVFFVKLGVGFFLLRLTPSINFKRFIWGTMAFTTAAFIANLCT